MRPKERQSSLPAPGPRSLLTALSSSWLMGPVSLRGYEQDSLQGVIKLIFWLLSLMSQSVTFHWKLKEEEKGELHWFTVLLDFWLERERSCGLTCKITHLSPLKVSDLNRWVIYRNSVSLHNCRYRVPRRRWEAILSRWNQGIVFPNLSTLNSEGKKEGIKRNEEREGGRWREEKGNSHLSSN